MKKSLIALLLPLAAFAQNGYEGPGRYEILSNLSQKVLDLDRNDQRTVIQFDNRNTDNQTWDIQDAGGGFVYIRNGMNGHALTQTRPNNSEPVAGEPMNNSDMQRWRFEPGNNGTVIIVNASGKALDIPSRRRDNGVRINTYDKSGQINQQWILRRIAGVDNRIDRRDRNRRRQQDTQSNPGGSRYDNNPPFVQPGAGTGNRDKYYDQNADMWKIDGDGVCFYTQPEYHGDAFCVLAGDQRMRMSNDWNNSFSSLRFFGRAARVTFADQANLRGRTETITRDVPNMRNLNRGNWNNRISSMRVD
jgi:hypothetical protein